MYNSPLAYLSVIAASLYVFLLVYLAGSVGALQKVIVLPLIIMLLALYLSSFSSLKSMLVHRGKWLFLFLCTILIQMLVVSTGGIKSPFLIFIHLGMIGLSFVFTFSLSLFFLLASFSVILADVSFYKTLLILLIEDPTTLVLQVISLIAIVPIGYIISQRYHLKDTLFKELHKQVVTDKAILANLKELIIITDPNLHILSVNDSVEKTLRQSRAELLDKYIFDVLLLKDRTGKVVTKKTFFPSDKDIAIPAVIENDFTLVGSPFAQSNVSMRIQPIQDVENNINQLSFIVSFNAQTQDTTITDMIEKARTKYEAMVEYIKKKLESPTPELQEIKMEMIMLQKVENDMYYAQMLKDQANTANTTQIDIAQLCKQITVQEQPLAAILKVPLEFTLKNFGQKDIEPLVVKDFQVAPEQLTGPFFTVACNVRYVELIIKKIIDLCLLSAATVRNPSAAMSLERGNNDDLIITATASCPELTDEDIANVFVPYYGSLSQKTYLSAGSGLEGFLLKSATDALNLKLELKHDKQPLTLTFTLTINKGKQPAPTKNPSVKDGSKT